MDVEKTIEFILEQQGAVVNKLNQLTNGLNQLSNVVLDLATAQEKTNALVETLAERHIELVDSHKEIVDSHKELAQRQKELAEQQKTTAQNLNTLISMVEHHLADHKHLARQVFGSIRLSWRRITHSDTRLSCTHSPYLSPNIHLLPKAALRGVQNAPPLT